MSRYNHLGLTAVMVLLGLLLVSGSLLSSVGTAFFPFDQYVGTRSSVAGVAFGVGIALAGFRPSTNVTWVRFAILYCILELVAEIVEYFWLGPSAFNLIPFVISIIFGVLLIALYPRRGDLMPSSDAPPVTAAPATAAGQPAR